MKTLLSIILTLNFSINSNCQIFSITIDSSKFNVFNRNVTYNEKEAHLNGKTGDGILWLKDFVFSNGEIELDIKGKDLPGKSFVGFAFHGLNDSTYDAIYFRPFNFKNPERSTHSIQYVSHPKYTWYKLREENPGKYENNIDPVPNPNEWFHVKLVVTYPEIKVFVNGSEKQSLEVIQISDTKKGSVGFWVGNGSEGYFKNLIINKKAEL